MRSIGSSVAPAGLSSAPQSLSVTRVIYMISILITMRKNG